MTWNNFQSTTRWSKDALFITEQSEVPRGKDIPFTW